ncbi:MAG: hypothetical protein R3C27_14430 [Hyphomonadaceae bacterium]
MSNELSIERTCSSEGESQKTFVPDPRARRRRGRVEVDATEQMRVLSLLRETVALHDEALDDPEVMMIIAEGEADLMGALDCMVDAE